MPEFHLERFPNGLRLLTIEMPHLHSAEMLCYVGVGSRYEAEHEGGISHFLEHMLFRGTEDYPKSFCLEAAFESIGGAVNASTDAEATCYHTRFHPDRLDLCAQLFASLLRRPLLEGIEVERRIIIEEALEDYNEQGIEINADNLTSRLLWPGHPLSQPTIGTSDSLAAMSIAALQRHHQTFYTPHNTVIAVAGAITHTNAQQAISAAFANWEGQPAPPPNPWSEPATEQDVPESVWVHDSDSQVGVQLAFRLPGRSDARQMELRVLRRLLTCGGTSRLLLRLREELGLTYSVDAALSLFAESGCLSIDLAVAPENLVAAIREVLAVLNEIRTTPVSAEELERLKATYLYDLDFSQDHTDEMATRYGWGEICGTLRTTEDDRQDVIAITADSLQKAAWELLTPQRLKLAVVGPFRRRDQGEIAALLNAFGKINEPTATKKVPCETV
ncbi:MAG: insulinase family protein [Desulfuromonadales bacterium]|nr:insulinase family protein [Desulfuromonadales bacterium]